jgi:hypothetical protein
MTPAEYEQRSCLTKAAYESRAFAARECKRLERQRGGGRVVPYRCRFKDEWHIGHSVPKHIRRRNRA